MGPVRLPDSPGLPLFIYLGIILHLTSCTKYLSYYASESLSYVSLKLCIKKIVKLIAVFLVASIHT